MSEHLSEVIENHATSKLPGGLYERTLMSKPIENVNSRQFKRRRRLRRESEPSRIPIRSLKRLRNKSRKAKLR